MNVQLRKFQASDAQNVAKYADNQKIAKWLRDIFPHPYTLADAEWYVNDCAANSETRQCLRAIVVDGEVVGSVGVYLQNDVGCKNAELGYWLGEPFWGQGIDVYKRQHLFTLFIFESPPFDFYYAVGRSHFYYS